MILTHEKAFEWLQREKDGRLGEAERRQLRIHLLTCQECRDDTAIGRRLASPAALWLAGGKSPRLSDRQVSGEVLQRLKLQKKWNSPLISIAWVFAGLLMLVIMSWTIEALLPGAAGAAPYTGATQGEAAGQEIQPVHISLPPDVPAWLGSLMNASINISSTISSGLLYLSLFGVSILLMLVLTLLGVILGLRRADSAWLGALVCAVGIGAAALIWSAIAAQGGVGFFILIDLPFLITAISLLALHVWNGRRRWSIFQWGLVLGLILSVLVLILGPWYTREMDQSFARIGFLTLFLVGLAPAVLWAAADWRPIGGWLMALITCLCAAGLVILFWANPAITFSHYPWLETLTGFAAALAPLLSVGLAAHLISSWYEGPHLPPWPRLAPGILIGVILFAVLYASLHLVAIRNSTAEDTLAGGLLLSFAFTAGVVAVVAASWRMNGRRILGYATLMAVFIVGQIPAIALQPGFGMQLTELRVIQVDQAIQRFHEQTGSYPASLEELTPKYLWRIPEPVTYPKSEWCYDASPQYYRLGYYTSDHYAYPAEVAVKGYAQAGELPAIPMPCQVELQKLIEAAR